MARISARLLGQTFNLSARKVNKLLEQLGYLKRGRAVTLSGSPTWDITEEGRKHGELSANPHSTGYIWDPEVADDLAGLLADDFDNLYENLFNDDNLK